MTAREFPGTVCGYRGHRWRVPHFPVGEKGNSHPYNATEPVSVALRIAMGAAALRPLPPRYPHPRRGAPPPRPHCRHNGRPHRSPLRSAHRGSLATVHKFHAHCADLSPVGARHRLALTTHSGSRILLVQRSNTVGAVRCYAHRIAPRCTGVPPPRPHCPRHPHASVGACHRLALAAHNGIPRTPRRPFPVRARHPIAHVDCYGCSPLYICPRKQLGELSMTQCRNSDTSYDSTSAEQCTIAISSLIL